MFTTVVLMIDLAGVGRCCRSTRSKGRGKEGMGKVAWRHCRKESPVLPGSWRKKL